MSKFYETPDEEMTVEIPDFYGRDMELEVITIFEVDGKDYIALLPIVDEDDEFYGNYVIYEYHENPDDPNEEPELSEITDDDVYEAVLDAFDEYLDDQEFDEIIED